MPVLVYADYDCEQSRRRAKARRKSPSVSPHKQRLTRKMRTFQPCTFLGAVSYRQHVSKAAAVNAVKDNYNSEGLVPGPGAVVSEEPSILYVPYEFGRLTEI